MARPRVWPWSGSVSRTAVAAAASLLAVAAATSALVLAVAPALAAGPPSSVTIAGSLQSEAGCGGDWDPACATTHMAYDANSDVWRGTWTLPAGNYEYKAAIDDGWDVSYGANATPNGANIPLVVAAAGPVRFYYDDRSHWVTDDHGAVIATAAGSFQSELGCAGDWDPACLRSWLKDPSGSGTYAFETTALPAGTYEVKVAIGETWDVNYGAGGTPNGANIPFTVPANGDRVRFSWHPVSHVLTVEVEAPAISLTVAASPATYVAAGQSIVYSFIAKNTGNVLLTGPVGIADDVLGTFACSSEVTLAPGGTISCTRTYVIRAADVNAAGTGAVIDHATATAAYMDGPVVSGPAGTTIHQVLPKPTDAPVVMSFSPLAGRAGSTVTISGTSFAYVRSVTFNGVAAAFSVRSGNTIVAIVPAGATTGPIRVTTPFGTGTSRTAYYVLR